MKNIQEKCFNVNYMYTLKNVFQCVQYTVFKYFFVACEDGYFGDMCTQKCSENCNQAGICNKTTGVCLDGCQPGWMGDFCDSGIFQFYTFHIIHILSKCAQVRFKLSLLCFLTKLTFINSFEKIFNFLCSIYTTCLLNVKL